MTTGKREIGKVSYIDEKKMVRDFEQSWEESLKTIKVNLNKDAIEDLSIQFRLKTHDFSEQVVSFQEFLRTVPILSAIKAWLSGKLADPHVHERYNIIMTRLFSILPLRSSKGDLITLEYLMEQGHKAIVEDIRSHKEWTMLEKEEFVQCYIAFSQSIARLTHNLVPYGVDPDRERVRQKAVSYEAFIDFVPHLSERDALIAKLLYFADMPMEEILSLQKSALDKKNFSVRLGCGSEQLPRHLFLELCNFIDANKSSQKLVFTNVRGAHVDRTHLNQSFSRASEKTTKKTKITPGTLLKLKHESESKIS